MLQVNGLHTFESIRSIFDHGVQGPLPLAPQMLLLPPSLPAALGAALVSLLLWDLLEVTSLASMLLTMIQVRMKDTVSCIKILKRFVLHM